MYVNTPMMRNLGFENGVHWPTPRPSFKILLFEWKWTLIDLRGLIDCFWQNNFAPKSRYEEQKLKFGPKGLFSAYCGFSFSLKNLNFVLFVGI